MFINYYSHYELHNLLVLFELGCLSKSVHKKILLRSIKCRTHIKPKLPAVNPIEQKKINSIKSLLPEGIAVSATLIR